MTRAGLVKGRNSMGSVIPAKAGIHWFEEILDPGACPGPDPGFAGVTLQKAFRGIIALDICVYLRKSASH